MQTYKYHFPAYGSLVCKEDAEDFTKELENHLNNSPACLGSYCMFFPSNSAILDHVSFDMNEKYAVEGINLHTYVQLNEGDESYLRDCVEENISDIFEQRFGEYNIGAFVNGDVECLGMEGEIPKTLYHITEKDYVEQISEKGIDQRSGGYDYMGDKRTIYLCEKEQLAAWLSVLKHNENPVIMEVDTEGLDIKTGSMYKDRDYIPNGYNEYYTTQPIPASAIKEAELTGRFCAEIHADMYEMSQKTVSESDLREVVTGMQRIMDMGILENADVQSCAEVAMERGIPEVGEDEEDMTQTELEDFTNAVNEIPAADSMVMKQ